MSDILLATKIHIPPLHSNLVNRPQLIQQLNEGVVNSRLTIISAPAGYGKSTLLGEWASQLNIPVAWLSLERGENVPARFWKYFITAFNEIPQVRLTGIGESISQVLDTSQPETMEVELIKLVNSFSGLEERVIMVLDDVNNITEPQIHQDLVFLIEHLKLSIGGLHLVVAGRMDPPWPLARWRARGELCEFHAADMRFDFDETVQFFHKYLQVNLSSQDIVALQDRTEGWIAGLQMAAVSMQRRLIAEGPQGVSRFIESFSGSNRFILDYLMDEVILQQPAEVRDFLFATSIPEQFTAPLCNALTDRQNSQTILEQLERTNLFLIPLDDERQWYRYHHLFAELLRKWLKQRQPARVAGLHQRASMWYAENNMLSQAIRHALDAGDVALLNRYTSANVLGVVEHTELLDMLRHFEELPDQYFLENPWLGVPYALVKAFVNPSGDVERILQKSEQGLVNLENTSFKQRLISLLDGIRAYLAWLKGEADQALGFVHRAMDNLPENDQMIHAQLLNLEGLAYQLQLKLPKAIQSFETALLARQSVAGLFPAMVNSNLVSAQFLQGRLRQAFSNCQSILRLANESDQSSKDLPFYNHLYATMSLVQLEWNNLESAIRFARESIALSEQWHQADSWQYTLSCLSRVLCAAGNLEEAFAINQRAMQKAVHVSPYYFRLSACDEIRLNLAKGDIPKAVQRCAEIEPLMKDCEKRGMFLLEKASLLYAQGYYAEILMVLEEPMRNLEKGGANWYLINLMPIQALALQALGREEDALRILSRCLTLAEPEGYVRVFVERGAPMARLLQTALRQGIEPKYITDLLSAFNLHVEAYESRTPASRFSGAKLIDPLSERELEVLRYLNTNLSTPEIAREMILAPSTIRTHVRNIYAKLGTHGRIEAIQKAKDLELI
ncbi:MAG: LuxR C-terminal-related transcriptional regulator [Chloroflexi bacterium]|nr:LuxR C-terminal-related transcriptional regulator [Chloroflexota bacterium]